MPLSERGDAAPMLGRGDEIQALTSMLDAAPSGGGALVLRGEPGIGKSRLLAAAAADARERGFTVLAATGAQSEARLPFAGLNQLLRPVRARAAALPPVLRGALDTAFGLTDGPAPERFRIAMAVLDLLTEAATEAPLLVIAEDAHWLDRTTADALAFVARRLENDPIVLLAAVRDGYGSALIDAGLPELRIGALRPDTAAEVLSTSGQRLTSEARTRLLREAAGNPLALIELPVAEALSVAGVLLPGVMPLTERLEQAFAARVSDLPETSRLLLLAAALIDGDRSSEVLRAGSAVAGSALDLEALEPAVQAAIIDSDERSVRFRHPLMRSAVVQGATAAQRRRMHAALADVLDDEPDRRVWHRAALITGVHEDVAVDLEEAGWRARRRGAVCVAVAAMRRASELSAPARRGDRLLATAHLAFELGQADVAALLREAERYERGPLQQARASFIEAMVDFRPLDAATASALIDAAEVAGDAGHHGLRIELLWLVAQRIYWVPPGHDAQRSLIAAAQRLTVTHPEDPRALAIHTYADPLGTTPEVAERLETALAARDHDPDVARYVGAAAMAVGAFDTAKTALAVAADGLRAEGRLGHLPFLLSLQGTVATRMADWDVAIPVAEEARRLAGELSEPLSEAGAWTVTSMIAGMRGDEAAAEEASAHAESTGLRLGANIVVSLAQVGRLMSALGAARHADAYEIAERLFDPADPAYHPVMAYWHIGDLVEAAVHVGQAEQARARVRQVEAAAGERPAIRIIDLSLRHARAILAGDDEDAPARFADALNADLGPWPFPRARLQLVHGQWLRRRRQIADSRSPLRAARDTFDALGCQAWGDQARRELRASGESSRRRDPCARDELTAQELQIAQLAADGLSNREIGQRLFLSHRTIGTHLYRVFPKLGITARSELRAALDAGRAT